MSRLFNSYCCHYYGSQAWNLEDMNVNKIFTAWNKAVRHLCKLPYNTHTRFLPYVIGTLHVREQIMLRTVKMLCTMNNSNNQIVNFLTKYSLARQTSIMSMNFNIAKQILDIQSLDELVCKKLYEKKR